MYPILEKVQFSIKLYLKDKIKGTPQILQTEKEHRKTKCFSFSETKDGIVSFTNSQSGFRFHRGTNRAQDIKSGNK